jgi:hypothetical protein
MDCPIINSNAEQRPGQLKRKAERLRDPVEQEGIGDGESVMGNRRNLESDRNHELHENTRRWKTLLKVLGFRGTRN